MNRDVVRLVAADEELWFAFGGMMYVALDPEIRSDFFENDTTNYACFRIPRYVIAPLERFRHIQFVSDGIKGCLTGANNHQIPSLCNAESRRSADCAPLPCHDELDAPLNGLLHAADSLTNNASSLLDTLS